MMRMGLDIGGTKMEATILDHQDRVLVRERIPTERDKGLLYVMDHMQALIERTLITAQIDKKFLGCLGIGLPGSVDPHTRLMKNGNTNIFIDHDVAADLRQRLGVNWPITIANDANCFALAEVLGGAGLLYQKQTGISPKESIGVGIILGTGVGGGIIINGKMHEGRRGMGGEIGHFGLNPNGPTCFCGRRGCAELYLSGHGLETRFWEKTGKKISAKDIFEQPEHLSWRQEYQENLLYFMNDLANILDPDFFVLGGGVSTRPEIYVNLEERLNLLTLVKNSKNPIRIFKHQLGDSAGVIGAAMLGLH